MYPYMIQGSNIVVVIKNQPHTISKAHVAYEKVKESIRVGDWDTVKKIIDPEKMVLNYGQGRVAVQGEKLFWDGREMHNALSRRMIQMLQENFSIQPFVLFIEHLYENPSYRAVNELYGFLEKNSLPITPDGCFLAYKRVNEDYTDVYSGTVTNKPAYFMCEEEKAAMPITTGGRQEVTVSMENENTVVSMPRNMVNDDKYQTCSEGLHFCSREYLDKFGGERIVILKINPRDVVSIPTDYNNSKGRACRYEVVGELGVDPDIAFTAAVQENANSQQQLIF